MTFASISAMVISLLILGVFLMLTLNVNYFMQQIGNQVQIKVFLDVNTPQDQVSTIQNDIGSLPHVVKVTFVSKQQGLQDMIAKFGSQGKELLGEFQGNNNPLNDSYIVQVDRTNNVISVADHIRAINNQFATNPILSVNEAKSTVEALNRSIRYIRNIGLALVTGLALTSMFLISNTIKLTIIARRHEIGIMKLVGATNNFIRWPFFIEGILLGFIGSFIPACLLLYGYWFMLKQHPLGVLMLKLRSFSSVGLSVGALLIIIGVLIGIWGTTISVRKFMKV